ncbi:MAG: anaerobic ribonucleoside-triphosphate reductase activating protein [bacterium]|nr:anaerobic ribonucleoside-triphosphate reductase activating protein [bacterium]
MIRWWLLLFIINGLQKTTLIDFPKKIASIVFSQGCNFRCGYCHNPELLSLNIPSTQLQPEEVLSFLKTRKEKLDGVVITGGEPTLQSGLYDFIKEIKSMGFLVKLDSNGTNPQILEKLIKENMLDYIAMDIKAPLEKYSDITNVKVNTENIQKSIKLIMESPVDYEFRTTVVKSQLSFDDFEDIGKLIKGAKRYYLQKFVASKIYDEKLKDETTYSNEEFSQICSILRKYIEEVDFR